MGSERVGTRLTYFVRGWLEAKEAEIAVRRSGGDQTCPWCRQGMNQFRNTHVREFSGNSMLDEIVCGNCGGTSIWKWEIGFIWIAAGDRPPSAECPPAFDDGPFIREVVKSVRRVIDAREASRRADLASTQPAPARDGEPHEGGGA